MLKKKNLIVPNKKKESVKENNEYLGIFHLLKLKFQN
jgi:hypothetical protein